MFIWGNEYQTPTDVSNMIASVADPAAAYKRWVLEKFSRATLENVYAEDDMTTAGFSIGLEIF